ncbi:hypothetical protein [Komagataeibacter sp. FNDCR2]|uniref:hypothetical protein n=1 Tax=Komagataeibacter sp. FNDCR2 TaxID=2878682 RepID=UPI001E2D2919|nr:hypothetical protein [Komagataeibacter sp. FNDCR2]MCE2576779.1 hypothetical protein [Komagataeibacter sp. FNDCR2]
MLKMLNFMKSCFSISITGIFLIFPLACSARCLGPARFQTCDDPQSGAHMDISRFGHETVIYGVRPESGETYQEFSTEIGHMTYMDGVDNQGRPQYEVLENFSHSFTDSYGTNASGKPYSHMEDMPPDEKSREERGN